MRPTNYFSCLSTARCFYSSMGKLCSLMVNFLQIVTNCKWFLKNLQKMPSWTKDQADFEICDLPMTKTFSDCRIHWFAIYSVENCLVVSRNHNLKYFLLMTEISREMFQNLNYDTILKTTVSPKIVGNAISESKCCNANWSLTRQKKIFLPDFFRKLKLEPLFSFY